MKHGLQAFDMVPLLDVIYLRGQIVSAKDLKVQLSQFAAQNLPVLIKADRRASVGRIVDVWDLCRVVGIEKINIATDSQQ
jgi:biopolymer transport protein ExbD